LDCVAGPEADEVKDLRFSRDSKHPAYEALSTGGDRFVRDGLSLCDHWRRDRELERLTFALPTQRRRRVTSTKRQQVHFQADALAGASCSYEARAQPER
jgi:hypothetical protein